jgi:glycosyltransferase involved in cell wall biosynthesis
MRVFHILPDKKDVCGGIKVHYQISQLERELGYDSYIVYEDVSKLPTWFVYSNIKHINIAKMHKIADKRRDVIVGWEDVEPLLRSGFHNKVSYIQGEVFVNRSNPYHGITIWFSNHFNRLSLPHLANNDSFIVTPYISTDVFNCPENDDISSRKYTFSIQERKGGRQAFNKIRSCLNSSSLEFISKFSNIHFIPDCNESEFASELRNTKIFIAHSYPEGLGLPALEAMASGCMVVGFTGGGGTTYMEHGINCLISPKDGDYDYLSHMLELAYNMTPNELMEYRTQGMNTVNRMFSRASTKAQVRAALEFFNTDDEEE